MWTLLLWVIDHFKQKSRDLPLSDCFPFHPGEGRGFEIAQGRLGPGRIHHCMRSIGAAETALEILCQRAAQRETFGKKLYHHVSMFSSCLNSHLFQTSPFVLPKSRVEIQLHRSVLAPLEESSSAFRSWFIALQVFLNLTQQLGWLLERN